MGTPLGRRPEAGGGEAEGGGVVGGCGLRSPDFCLVDGLEGLSPIPMSDHGLSGQLGNLVCGIGTNFLDGAEIDRYCASRTPTGPLSKGMPSLGGFFFAPLSWSSRIMQYQKAPFTFEQQADQLLARGMAGNRTIMVARLSATNYYRLSGYWYTFRESDPGSARTPRDTFKPGTTFDEVWARYVFDRRLRLLVMDAIERIEVAVRTQLAYHHAHDHGCFAYATEMQSLPKLGAQEFADFVQRVREETSRSKDTFVGHFRQKYGDCHNFLPVWMLAEVMTFGTMLTFYKSASRRVKQSVASDFGLPDAVFESWLLTLNAVRNICAHHGRLWNRELGVKPVIPRISGYPEWHAPVKVGSNRVFAVLTICRHCLRKVAPQSGWPSRVELLLSGSPGIPLASMGFPGNWKECPIWRGSK